MIDGGDDELVLFQAQAELTPWEWAKQRRVWFNNRRRDTVGGLVIAAIAAAVAALFGQPDWATTLAIAVMSLVLGAIVLPIGETVYCLMTRKSVLLEEAREEAAQLRRFLESQTDAREASTKKEQRLRSLGNMLRAYEQFERRFIAANGDRSLFREQTTLRNVVVKFLNEHYGRDRWTQFDSARERPDLLPPTFPSDDYDKMNLLCMVRGRKAWLSRFIDEVRRDGQERAS